MEKDPKILAIIKFLDFDEEKDYDRFAKSAYNDNIYIIDSDYEFLACTDEEADMEHHESFMNLVDDMGLDSFTEQAQAHILEHYIKDSDWFTEAYKEGMESYANDIKDEFNPPETICVTTEDGAEVKVQITNRLLQELIDNDILSASDLSAEEIEDGEYVGDRDLVGMWCDHFDSPVAQGYKDGPDWFRFEFGEDQLNEVIRKQGLIDWEGVCEYVKEMDGRGNELNSWDGREYEEDINGETYYIYPNCDFKTLESRDEMNLEEH